MSHSYDVGTKAWQTDQTEGWIASEVTEKIVDGDIVKLVFTLENGEVCLKMMRRHTILMKHSWIDTKDRDEA